MNLCKTHISDEAKANVARVLESGWCGLGPETDAFEKEFASYIGAKHAIATNSGTEALRLAVHIAARQTKRGYVVSTPNTFIASNSVLVQNDLYPVFADIDYQTGSILIEDAREAFRTYDCGLLMLVHYAGLPADIDAFRELATLHGAEIIHDCSHACGAIYGGKHLGADMKYGCFSFHAVKNLPIGEGGMLVTSDDYVAERARQLRWFGIDKSTFQRTSVLYSWDYNVTDYGYKSHMSDVAAAIGRGQLPYLDQWNAYRTTLVDRYRKNLESCGYPRILKHPLFDTTSSNYICVVLFKDSNQRQKAMDALMAANIQYGYHYKANYRYKSYADFPKMGTKNMEHFEQTALTLPLHLGLTEEDIDQVCAIIQEAICD